MNRPSYTMPPVFMRCRCETDRSLEILARAFEHGWGDRAWVETDSDLESLRSDHRFNALLEGMH